MSCTMVACRQAGTRSTSPKLVKQVIEILLRQVLELRQDAGDDPRTIALLIALAAVEFGAAHHIDARPAPRAAGAPACRPFHTSEARPFGPASWIRMRALRSGTLAMIAIATSKNAISPRHRARSTRNGVRRRSGASAAPAAPAPVRSEPQAEMQRGALAAAQHDVGGDRGRQFVMADQIGLQLLRHHDDEALGDRHRQVGAVHHVRP